MLNRHHYQPTEAQKRELAERSQKLRDDLAARSKARRLEEASRAQVLGMLGVVLGAKPLDNPVIESNFGELA